MLTQSSGEDECIDKTKKQLIKITKQTKKQPKKKQITAAKKSPVLTTAGSEI